MRLRAARAKLLGRDDAVRAQQRRSGTDPHRGRARDQSRWTAGADERRANRTADHRRWSIPGSHQRGAAQRVRPARARVGEHRTVRNPGLLGESAKARDRIGMALGANRPTVMRLVLRQGMSLVLTGVVIGFAAALVVARLLSRMLYGIGATDPASLAGAAAMLRRAGGLLSAGPLGNARRSAGSIARRTTRANDAPNRIGR